MRLSLSYPVKPFHLNQGFGASPEYYAKFHDQFGNPYKGHDGNDLMAVHGQPVYTPIDGLATYSTDAHGGEGVTIMTNEAYEYEGGSCWFQLLNWHLIGDTDPKYPKPFAAKQVKAGELIGYADNTGAPYESSGDHLHFGLKPVDKNGKLILPGNGFNGAIDATPYFNGQYAVDVLITPVVANVVKVIPVLEQEVNTLPVEEQPYYRQVIANILQSLVNVIRGVRG